MGRGLCLLFSLGLLGAVWLLPSVRRRRARRAAGCRRCGRNARVAAVVIPAGALLLVAGAVVRTQAAVFPLVPCSAHLLTSGAVVPEPIPRLSVPPTWDVARRVVLSGVSGLALAGGRLVGMDACQSSQPVVFWRPPRTSAGGSIVGETFVAWNVVDNGGRPSERHGFGIMGEQTYLRFGPNITRGPEENAALAVHESRHVDQAAVLTTIGGPVVMPLLYTVDDAFYPAARNHFERAAGLDAGGYSTSPGTEPDPQWAVVGGIVALLAFVLRTRIRLLSRMLARGRAAGGGHAPDRCPRHSPGWFGAGP